MARHINFLDLEPAERGELHVAAYNLGYYNARRGRSSPYHFDGIERDCDGRKVTSLALAEAYRLGYCDGQARNERDART